VIEAAERCADSRCRILRGAEWKIFQTVSKKIWSGTWMAGCRPEGGRRVVRRRQVFG